MVGCSNQKYSVGNGGEEADGWPGWLKVVAGEAIKGWPPRMNETHDYYNGCTSFMMGEASNCQISECKQLSQWCWRSCFLSNTSLNCFFPVSRRITYDPFSYLPRHEDARSDYIRIFYTRLKS